MGRKRTGESLLQFRQRLTDIIDHLPDATLSIDSERRISSWNRAMEELMSVKAADVMGKGNSEYALHLYGERRPLLIDLIFEPDSAIEKWGYTNIKRDGFAVMAETIWARPHQKPMTLWGKATPLFDRDGKQIGAIESIRDITELRQTEAVLRESEEKFRVLAETSPAAIFFYQEDRFVYVNPAAERMTGYSKEELYGMKFWDWIHPEFQAMVREYAYTRQLNKPVPSQYEFKYVKKNGVEGWALNSVGRIEYRGKPAVAGTIVDVTERKNAEKALKEAKNRAELYVDLMGHDISNMNHAAMGYLELAVDVMDLKEGRELITKPIEILQNSSGLIDNVKKIQRVKTGEIRQEIVDVGELLTPLVAQYSGIRERQIKIDYLPASGCFVIANKYMADVFSNIIDNSIKHSGGPLEIKIRISEVLKDSIKHYRINFEDNGRGIPDEKKKYIFMDLLNEGSRTRRIGFGLQLVKAIVESVNGKVWVEDCIPGDYSKGSKFVVLLQAS